MKYLCKSSIELQNYLKKIAMKQNKWQICMFGWCHIAYIGLVIWIAKGEA